MADLLRIDQKPLLGRFACAAKNIIAGELFIDENPFVVGPKPCTPPICLGCYIPINGGNDGPRCPRCHWPLCSKCKKSIDLGHHAAECAVFVEHKVKFQSFPYVEPCMQLDCITPLRMLLAKENDPDKWENEIMKMEYHPKERFDSPIYRADETNVVRYLRGPCNLKERFSAELIQQVCGILEINSFEARTVADNRVRCIYPKAAVMAHSCKPNTSHTILPSDSFRIQFRASENISEGAPLYATYTFTLTSTQNRQKHLQLSKFFQCKCNRCIDPTELGTNFSSFICQKCSRGLIAPIDPIDESTEWHCSDCSFTTSNECIQKSLSLIEAEIESLEGDNDANNINDNIRDYEIHLTKYGRILHPNHFLQVKVKEILIVLYAFRLGSKNDFQSDMAECLERRLELCQCILDLLNIFQPGLNRAKSMILYEIYSSTIALIKVNWNSLENRDEQIADVNKLIGEYLDVLKWEDPTSVEYSVAVLSERLSESMLMMSLDEIPMN